MAALHSVSTGDFYAASDIDQFVNLLNGTTANIPTTLSGGLNANGIFAVYGADSTGAVTSSAAINNAIVAAHAAGGGTVVFAAGLYSVDASIALLPGVNLCGAGAGNTIIQCLAGITPAYPFHMLYGYTGLSGGIGPVRIEKIGFSLNNVVARAITFTSYHDIVICDCSFITATATPGSGGYDAAINFSVDSVTSSSRAEVTGCLFSGLGLYGIALYTPTGTGGQTVATTKIHHNTFLNCYGYTVHVNAIAGFVDNTSIHHNTILDQNGDTIGSGQYGALVNAGLAIAYMVHGLKITNNIMRWTVANKRRFFAMLYSCIDVTISGNICICTATDSSTPDSAFLAFGRISSPDIGVTVSDNVFNGGGMMGFSDPDALQDALIAGNVVRNCTTGCQMNYGVAIRVRIDGNLFYNSISAAIPGAIIFSNAAPVDCAITNNTIVDDRMSPTMLYGIQSTGYDAVGCVVDGNIISLLHGTISRANFLKKQASELSPFRISRTTFLQSTGTTSGHLFTITTPTIAASTAFTNTTGADVTVHLSATGTTGLAILLDTVAIYSGAGQNYMAIPLPAGSVINLGAYAGSAPTWVWEN